MKKFFIVGALLCFSALAFTGKHSPDTDYTVTIDASAPVGTVSPNIMGFNMVYCYETDEPWQNGNGLAAGLMKNIGTRQFRWPGGTVVTKFHWEQPTGQGWSDLWDPNFDASKNTDPSKYIDLDEYLAICQKMNTEPLMGINMGSGKKYNRVQEGVDEAIRLMKHCRAKGIKVKYYYLDNEPYQHDANYTYTPEEYGDMINIYASAMKKVDPEIKIIANTQPRTDLYIKPMLARAGKNIDLVDVHMYWKWQHATFANWTAEPMMTHQNQGTYAEQRGIWEKIFADAGYPNIKLCILEWNTGPIGQNTPPTENQAALMIGEQFTQYVQSGLFMGCFWPMSLPNANAKTSFRPLFNTQNGVYKPNKAYDMFALYTNILGQQQVKDKVSVERLISLAVKSNDGKTVWVYLINKNQEREATTVDIDLKAFKAGETEVTGFDSEGRNIQKQTTGLKPAGTEHYQLSVPKNSLVRITFKSV